MRNRNELDIERPDIDAPAGRHHGDRNFRRIAFGLTFGFEQGGTELGRIDRTFQSRPEIDDSAEMVLMSVRQHEPNQIIPLFFKKADVRHDQVDAGQMLLIAKRDAQIYGKPGPLVAIAEPIDRQVHSDLADPAERRKGQFIRPRHQVVLADAARPKWTSPAVIRTRFPAAVRTTMQPCSSRVSNVPSIATALLDLTDTASPSPTAPANHNFRMSPKPRPLFQMP